MIPERVQYWIRKLDLRPHPEGGYYKEVYRSEELIEKSGLSSKHKGSRPFLTSIYYLLAGDDFSAFHRIASDEIWHFYEGGSLIIHQLSEEGAFSRLLSKDSPQLAVKGGIWFAAELAQKNSFALVGCTVGPGFDFNDFELAKKEELLPEYPGQQELIKRLCR